MSTIEGPRLVVLVPVHQNEAGLDRSLNALGRGEGCFDVVVVDDGSPRAINAPSQLPNRVHVSVLRLEKNLGIAAALNHGLRHILARGYSYIARLDAGDVVAPERFERQQCYLDTHLRCAAVSSFVDFVDENQKPLFRHRPPCEHSRIVRELHLNNCLLHSGVTIRVAAFRECGPYREDVPGAEDYELFLRLAQRYTLAVIPEVLTRCEYSAHGLSVSGRRTQQRERLKLQLQYFALTSPHSFYGVARTLAAMLIPQAAVFWLKQAHLRQIQ